jgi:hypothetical protein
MGHRIAGGNFHAHRDTVVRYFLLIAAFIAVGLALDGWLGLPPDCGGRYNRNRYSEACQGVDVQLVLKKLWDKATGEVKS